MRVLGIDPGSNIAGFGIVDKEGQSISLVVSGIIRTKSKEHPKKLKQLFDSISEIIQTYKPSIVVVETPFLGKNANSLIKLSQARAMALVCAEIRGLRIIEMAPREIKRLVTGTGDAMKEDVRKIVGFHLKMSVDSISLDASDAIGCAIAFIFKHKP
jgi:crossover junction endodeoxyribonuclease RuvC